MNRLIFPEIIKGHVVAFFTGKDPGADPEGIGKILKIKREDIYMPLQKHTDKIILLESPSEPKIADAVITKKKGLLIGIQVADCVPILIYEKDKGVIGAVHAGWRGTAEGLLKKTIEAVMDKFVCGPEKFSVAMGPSIKGCCYSVGHEVLRAVERTTGKGEYYLKKGGKYCLDLPSANKYQAMSLGVPESNIWISEDCTFCRPDKYYSYRYAKGPTGRQGGFIGLKE